MRADIAEEGKRAGELTCAVVGEAGDVLGAGGDAGGVGVADDIAGLGGDGCAEAVFVDAAEERDFAVREECAVGGGGLFDAGAGAVVCTQAARSGMRARARRVMAGNLARRKGGGKRARGTLARRGGRGVGKAAPLV